MCICVSPSLWDMYLWVQVRKRVWLASSWSHSGCDLLSVGAGTWTWDLQEQSAQFTDLLSTLSIPKQDDFLKRLPMKELKERDPPLRASSVWLFIQIPTFNNGIYDYNNHLSITTYPILINPKTQLSYFIWGGLFLDLSTFLWVCKACSHISIHTWETYRRLSNAFLGHFSPYSLDTGSLAEPEVCSELGQLARVSVTRCWSSHRDQGPAVM